MRGVRVEREGEKVRVRGKEEGGREGERQAKQCGHHQNRRGRDKLIWHSIRNSVTHIDIRTWHDISLTRPSFRNLLEDSIKGPLTTHHDTRRRFILVALSLG